MGSLELNIKPNGTASISGSSGKSLHAIRFLMLIAADVTNEFKAPQEYILVEAAAPSHSPTHTSLFAGPTRHNAAGDN